MKILVVFTGGTIGSSVQGEYIQTNEDMKYQLIESYLESEHAEKVQFETVSPYTLLSENLDGNHINQLVSLIQRTVENDTDSLLNGTSNTNYDGIIVTHGTDTLQYSAAALWLTTKPSIPVVLVSSNYILSDARANGLTNFAEAVKFIKQREAGVFVSYCNQGSSPQIHPADALLPHQPYSDDIISLIYDSPPIRGKYADTLLTNVCPVLYIKATPGITYPILSAEVKAVLLETYHSGTLNTEGTALSDFVKQATACRIPIYIVGVEARLQYESTKAYEDLPFRILPKCSTILAYMALWYQYSKQ